MEQSGNLLDRGRPRGQAGNISTRHDRRDRLQSRTPLVLAAGGDDSPELASIPNGAVPLVHVCRLFGHGISAYPARNLDELCRAIMLTGSVGCLPGFRTNPIILHVSVSGDANGMAIGGDRATWGQLVAMILNSVLNLNVYPRPVTLSLSAPGANEERLAGLLSRYLESVARPPDQTFVFVDRPPKGFDTILAWTHFYREAAEPDFTANSVADRPNVRRPGMGRFRYFHS